MFVRIYHQQIVILKDEDKPLNSLDKYSLHPKIKRQSSHTEKILLILLIQPKCYINRKSLMIIYFSYSNSAFQPLFHHIIIEFLIILYCN